MPPCAHAVGPSPSSMRAAEVPAQAAVLQLLDSAALPPPDVELLFDDEELGAGGAGASGAGVDDAPRRRTLRAHSVILSMWSSVLRTALQLHEPAAAGSGCSPRSAGAAAAAGGCAGRTRTVPLPGTSLSEWMMIAPFLYPVTPVPEVSWANLESLLTLGTKFDMAALLARADRFVQTNADKLECKPGSPAYVWRILQLCDAARLDTAAAMCADRAVALARGLGVKPDQVSGLSVAALTSLVLRLAPVGPPQCPRCGCSRVMRCSYCSYSST